MAKQQRWWGKQWLQLGVAQALPGIRCCWLLGDKQRDCLAVANLLQKVDGTVQKKKKKKKKKSTEEGGGEERQRQRQRRGGEREKKRGGDGRGKPTTNVDISK